MAMQQKYIQQSLFPEEKLEEPDTLSGRTYDLTNLFKRLSQSDFRSHFYLTKKRQRLY